MNRPELNRWANTLKPREARYAFAYANWWIERGGVGLPPPIRGVAKARADALAQHVVDWWAANRPLA